MDIDNANVLSNNMCMFIPSRLKMCGCQKVEMSWLPCDCCHGGQHDLLGQLFLDDVSQDLPGSAAGDFKMQSIQQNKDQIPKGFQGSGTFTCFLMGFVKYVLELELISSS